MNSSDCGFDQQEGREPGAAGLVFRHDTEEQGLEKQTMMPANRGLGSTMPKRNLAMKLRRIKFLLLVIAALTAFPVLAKAQSLADSEDSSGTVPSTTPAPLKLTYTRPTDATKFRNYVFD